MIEGATLTKGMRVRLRSASHVLMLDADTGVIVRPDDKREGYYIVRLDRPARYDNGVRAQELTEIREAADNLQVLDPRSPNVFLRP